MATAKISSAAVLDRALEIAEALNQGEFTRDEVVVEALALYAVAHLWGDGIETTTDLPGVARQMVEAEGHKANLVRRRMN